MSTSTIKKVAILGGGVIGSSWATNFIWQGVSVNVYDIDENCLKVAQERVTGNLKYLAQKGIITSEKMIEAISLATYTADIEDAVSDVQFIQEAGPEQYETKQALLAECDQYAPSDAVFATSSSGLLITEIAKYSNIPERCIGAHPYNPPHLIPLVEIGKGEKTSEETVRKTYDFYRSLGKEPIVLQKEALGFIANRLSVALYREAIDLVVRGVCSVEDIDKAVSYGPGLRYALMGPNLIYQLGGGPYGIQGILHHIGPSVELWWADMADWKKWPEGWGEKAQNGVNKTMANRPPEQGRTPEEIVRWRDDKLLELLKILGKL
jgi:carnitine 3-dehydrogenase